MPEVPPALLARIHEVLDEVEDPCSVAGGTPMGLSEMGLVKQVTMSARGDVAVELRLTAPFCHMIAFLQSETVARVGALPGVRSVEVTTDQGLDWSPELISGGARRRREQRVVDVRLAARR